MSLEFKKLEDVDSNEIIELMNHPLVRRQMPLTFDDFNQDNCDEFIKSKYDIWQKYGYGPWAFFNDGAFVGWGGFQPEQGIPDLALVLHPSYWGMGKRIANQVIEKGFLKMGFSLISVLFPPTRHRVKGLLKLGFKEIDHVNINDHVFIRYELTKDTWLSMQ